MRVLRFAHAAACLLLLGVTVASSIPVGAQEPTPPSPPPLVAQGGSLSPALGGLAACVQGSKSLNVVFLVDESASLLKGPNGTPGTDPFDQRVEAGQAALDGLGKLVERSGGKIDVNVLLAGFSVDFVERSGWRRIDSRSAEDAKADLEAFRERDNGLDTDYHNALQGALESLQQKSAERPPDLKPPCTAVLWFTDGSYSVEDRTSDARQKSGVDGRGIWNTKEYSEDIDLAASGGGFLTALRGLDLICRPDGLADKLRQSNTTLLAVALTSGGPDTSWLDSISGGGPASVPPCGATPGDIHGQLFPAGDLDSLLAAFDEIVQSLGNPASTQSTETGVCPQTEATCPRGTQAFQVDPALRRFHLLAQPNAPGIKVVVQSPVGEPIVVDPVRAERAPTGPATGAKQLRGSSTTWAWISGTALALDAESTGSDTAGWAGTWTVTFIDVDGLNPDAVVKARIFLFGDVAPSLEPTRFRAGEDNEFRVTVVRPEASAGGISGALAGLDGTISIDGDVTDPATALSTAVSKLERVGDEWVGTYRAPQDLESPSVNLTLRLSLITASGIALPPSAATFPVTVLPPKGFPTLGVERLAAGIVEGLGDNDNGKELLVPVRGSDRSETCVWLAGTRINTPAGEARNIDVLVDGAGGSEQDCLEVEKDGDDQLVLRVQPLVPARTLETGSVRIGLRSVNDNEARFVELPLTAQLIKPANKSVVAGLLALLLVAGIGLPFLILFLTNVALAKFAETALMESAEIRVRVSDRGVERGADGAGTPFEWDDFTAVGGARSRSKTFVARSVNFVAKVSPNPFVPPAGRAETAHPSFGSHRTRTVKGNATIPLWVSNEWVFEAQDVDEEGAVEGRLLGFVLATEKPAGLQRLNASVRDTLPGLREAAGRAVEAERRAALERAKKKQPETVGPEEVEGGIWATNPVVRTSSESDDPFSDASPSAFPGDGEFDLGSVDSSGVPRQDDRSTASQSGDESIWD